jgi:hypothetical protein
MDDDTFLARLADWEALPGDIHDEGYGLSPFPCPLDTKFDALCALFLQADEQQRQMLPKLFKAEKSGRRGQSPYIRFDNLGLSYIRRLARSALPNGTGQTLRRGLAAAAIVQEYPDYRDIIISLAFLHLAARKAGIDPAPAFTEVAALARPETQAFLLDFLRRGNKSIDSMVQAFGGLG